MHNIILFLLILVTPFTLQQQQIDISQLPGALSQIPLSDGMSATVQFVQYSDHLSYTLYLNPNNVQYWNTSICLAWIVGTPSLLLDSTHQCSFMNDTSSKACIPDIPSNPCITPIKLPDACSNIETLSGSYPLTSSDYTTTTPIISVNSTNTQIYPNARNTIAGKSVLISLTENLNGTQQQFISCSNIRLGNGTTSNFTYYPVNNGTIQFPNHASRTLLSPIALLLFIITLFIHTLNVISK